MRLIHAMGFLNPLGINERFTFSSVSESYFFLNNFFLTHLYPFISFCFLHFYIPISLGYLALHRYINISLFVTHKFTPTKDYGPKRQFFKKFSQFTTVYNLTNCKTVYVETPTQHSIYDTHNFARQLTSGLSLKNARQDV